MICLIVLEIKLEAIKYFLNKTLETVDSETTIVCERRENDEFKEVDDFSNALFFPIQTEEIAIRAVFGELHALIEHYAQQFAIEPYQNSAKHAKIPKSLLDMCKPKLSDIKCVSDLNFWKLISLIEKNYRIKFRDFPGFNEIKRIRKVVNAFKHRDGFKDFRQNPGATLVEKFELTREDAYQAIDKLSVFLRTLCIKVEQIRNKTNNINNKLSINYG